ncbi:(Fe-S)-binding protein [Labilibacter sediminis]|nr:(Fe-S)-binding protein [Labilibacter sediminis]
MTVDLFIPCFIDQMFPNIGWSVVKILESQNVEVNYNPKQTCCGQPTFNSGFWKHSKKSAIKFIKDFPNDRPIVVPSASCAGYVKNHYTKLFEDDPEYLDDCERLKRNVIELTDFLVNHLKVTDFNASFPHKVTYHDACSALREYGLKDEPRKLIANVKGLELTEMEDRHTCCGFGGTFMVKFVPISTAMVEQKVKNALNTGAEYIVSTEASCLLNIQSYINEQKLTIKTIHLADILARNL